MKKLIMTILITGALCSYIDKSNIKLEDIASNKIIVSTYEEMRKIGNTINNGELSKNFKKTTSNAMNKIKNIDVDEIEDYIFEKIIELRSLFPE